MQGTDREGYLVIRFPWHEDTEGRFDPAQSTLERYRLFGDTPMTLHLDEESEKAMRALVLKEWDAR